MAEDGSFRIHPPPQSRVDPDGSLTGAAIGPFRLVRPIGSGGMGTVYEAVQQNPHRTVAVKILNLGGIDPERLKRFEVEAETLGLLHHPAIAQVYESGVATLGEGEGAVRVPYFAMEHVEDARTIFEHAAREKLDLRARLALFLEVCDAVQHAHRRGVIHRDLKGGNILVDGGGRPKVIDFGLARSRSSKLNLTQPGLMMGTPGTMAPEQAAGSVVDVRADVYSLGAVLYELVCGRPPITLEGSALTEIARAIQEDPPPPPSAHRPDLPRELDWILARALEKQPDQRYGSVEALAADLLRLLRHEPVEAGPPSTAYRVAKFVRRHRVLAGALLGVLGALLLGLASTSWGLVRARAAERVADDRTREVTRRAEDLAALNAFLERLITAPAGTAEGVDVRVVDVLDQAAEDLATQLADRPAAHLTQRETLVRAYLALGRHDRALAEIDRCLALVAEVEPYDRELRDDLRVNRVGALLELDRLDEAVAEARALVAEAKRAERDTPEPRIALGQALAARDELPEAEAHLRAALAMLGEAADDDSIDRRATANAALSDLLVGRGRLSEALSCAEESLRLRELLYGTDSPHDVTAQNAVALVQIQRGEPAAAIERLQRQLDLHAPRFGFDHPWMLGTVANLAGALLASGRPEEALARLEEPLERALERYGEEHQEVLALMEARAGSLFQSGDLAGAVAEFRACLDLSRKLHGEAHPRTTRYLMSVLGVLQRQGRAEESIALAEAELARCADELGPDSEAALERRRALALLNHGLGRLDAAEEQHRAVLAGALALQGRTSRLARAAALDLGYLLHEGRGALAEAEETDRLALSLARESVGEEARDTRRALANLAAVLADDGRAAEGEALLAEHLAAMRAKYGPGSPEAATAVEALAEFLDEEGRTEQACALCAQALASDSGPPEREELHTADLRASWAELLLRLDRTAEARAQLECALATHRAVGGPFTASTRSIEARLGSLEPAESVRPEAPRTD